MKQSDLKKISTKELEDKIREHNKFYFVDNKPVISDYDFDQLVLELKSRKPNSLVLNELFSDSIAANKISHDSPMLSLDKCYDEKTVNEWSKKINGDVIASPKIDGAAVSIKYGSDGSLIQAATRGDGSEGEEITSNIIEVRPIPNQIKLSNVEVRGEIFMPLSVFQRYKEKFANPRNLAAGAIKQKDPKKTAEYNLSFYAYDLLNADLKTEKEKRDILKKHGIPVAPWVLIPTKEIQATYEDFLSKRDKNDFETDGVVFKINDVLEQERFGSTSHHPRYAIAYKYQGESGMTLLQYVDWNVSRTGVITPVAVVSPVELSGAMVTRASLHNVGIVKKLKLTKNAKIVMMRRGGVIPNVESVIEAGDEEISIPQHCPSCGGAVKLQDDFLFCQNPSKCVKSKIAELEHFIKEIGCDGFGEKLVSQLYENGLVTSSDEFYTLTKDDLMQLDRMGETLAAKLITAINDKRELALDVFLRSLGIREVGKHVSQILGEYQDIDKVMSLTEEDLSSIHTIGNVIAREVVNGLKGKKDIISKLLEQIKIKKSDMLDKRGPLSGKKFLFTGTLVSMERREAESLVEKNGARIASSVSNNLDYLVVGDGGKAGSKLDKAKELSEQGGKVKVIGEKDFLRIVGK